MRILLKLFLFATLIPQAHAGSDFLMDWDALNNPPRLQEQRPRPRPAPAPVPAPPTPPRASDDARTEAGITVNCPGCQQTDINMRNLQALVSGSRAADMASWKRSRGLVQIPTRGSLGNLGPCGSHHYSPDLDKRTGEVLDNYAAPIAACAFMSVLQDWKKRCPNSQSGCRVAWGDISHKTKRKFNKHQTHTDGNCIDIRPMRRGKFDDEPLFYQKSDRGTTIEFINMLRDKGGTKIIYDDPQAGAIRNRSHANHIHVCFHNNQKTKNTCANYKYDPEICGPN